MARRERAELVQRPLRRRAQSARRRRRDQRPAFLTGNTLLGVSWWDWLAGPSVAMSAFILMAVFTTSGTFMLLFIAGLQNIGGDVQEAAMMDGASGWQRFWRSPCRSSSPCCSPC